MPSTAEKAARLTNLFSQVSDWTSTKGAKALQRKKQKGWGQKEHQLSTLHTHAKCRTPVPRGYEIAQLPGSAHASFTVWPQNLGYLSHGRTNYTCKNPDKYLSSLHLEPSREEILQPFQATQFTALLFLWYDKRNSEHALKTTASYLIHLNVQNRSVPSCLWQSLFEDSSHPPSALDCCSLC